MRSPSPPMSKLSGITGCWEGLHSGLPPSGLPISQGCLCEQGSPLLGNETGPAGWGPACSGASFRVPWRAGSALTFYRKWGTEMLEELPK